MRAITFKVSRTLSAVLIAEIVANELEKSELVPARTDLSYRIDPLDDTLFEFRAKEVG